MNKTVKYLRFSNATTLAVSYCIFEGTGQLHLDLSGVNISDSDAELIAEGLKLISSLQTLKIGSRYPTSSILNGSQVIVELLKTNSRLKTIQTVDASQKDKFDEAERRKYRKSTHC